MKELSFKYPHKYFEALRKLKGKPTYYTSCKDYIMVQYNGGWLPYNEFRKIKAFNHLPEANLAELKCEAV